MPYAVLVSALGAIIAAVIALFGFRTSTDMIVAPIIGAPLGFTFAIMSLRRHGLPLDSKLEDYRSAAGITSEAPKAYLNAAFGIALIVVLVELPSIMFGQDAVLLVCAAVMNFSKRALSPANGALGGTAGLRRMRSST